MGKVKAHIPRFIVFEGPDGVGKTSLAEKFVAYLSKEVGENKLLFDCSPGKTPGTIGRVVYDIRHNRLSVAPKKEQLAPESLQLLHVAAHVDKIISTLKPHFKKGGYVVLDRFWWSAYAYGRLDGLNPTQMFRLLQPELMTWEGTPSPLVFYIHRKKSLSPGEYDQEQHFHLLQRYYQELIRHERKRKIKIIEIENEDFETAFAQILKAIE